MKSSSSGAGQWVQNRVQLSRFYRRLNTSTTARKVRKVYGPPPDPAKVRAQQLDTALAQAGSRERAVAEGRR